MHAGRRPLRAPALVLLLGFAAAFVALYGFADLTEDVLSQETQQLDAAVLAWCQQFRSPVLDSVAGALSLLGSEWIYVLAGLALGGLGLRGRWGAALGLLLATGGAALLNSGLKTVFQRTRPEAVATLGAGQGFAFPSGHAMVAAAFYCCLAYLSWRVLHGGWRVAGSASLLVLVLLIGWSRLYLGVHYLTDVVAGYLAGFLWADLVLLSGHLLTRRPRR